uniref:Xpo1 domain-containing protein n=1 Tax=Angiostrongylus cantonensis TaxID=6313 RepID=A0A0K0DC28_ANGCA
MFKRRFPCEDTVAACILLMGSRYPANVQYFAAVSMYETIRHRYEECVANMEVLKSFLIESLTTNAHVQMQSITNKLSSTLAILSLYCMPDVWSDPVATLTTIWAAQPELLLRVLAEIAAEFSNIQMPLTQRSKLKTELHKTSEDIIRIISTVMGADDASPSTRQAAVECVEQWVKLPGIGLHQWASVLSVVFSAVSEDSICSCQGSYAVDELISDLPSSFFMTLREHIGSVSLFFCIQYVLEYRMVRSEVSIDAYFITGRDTLKFLNMELEGTIAKGDLCRTECIMFLWETVADYLSESDYLEIYDNLKLCMQLSNIGEGADEDRLANTVMRHLYALSHLIQEHDDLVGDDISQISYTFFMNESNTQELRLMALKCIGYVLSMKPSHDVMVCVFSSKILFKAIFVRIQVELIRATVESLSEVLFFFMKEFSTETRCVLDGLDHGDSPLVAAMFREIGNLRNFKQMTLRLNMASRKGACS